MSAILLNISTQSGLTVPSDIFTAVFALVVWLLSSSDRSILVALFWDSCPLVAPCEKKGIHVLGGTVVQVLITELPCHIVNFRSDLHVC